MKRRRDRPCDAGSATLWIVAFSLVVWVVAAAVVVGGVAVVARHRAATAADLAALAAAGVLRLSEPSADAACDAADSVAQANGAVLASCDVVATTVTVVASVDLRGLVQLAALGATSVSATARAGAA